MYLMDEFKGRDDYEKLLYIEATSAGSVCTIARAFVQNIKAYMSDSELHPSVLLTMRNLEQMIAMRDDWLNRLRDMRDAERAPLPFDETIGASVPIDVNARAKAVTTAIAEATHEGSDADVDRILSRAREAIGLPAEEPAPSRKNTKRKKSAAASA